MVKLLSLALLSTAITASSPPKECGSLCVFSSLPGCAGCGAGTIGGGGIIGGGGNNFNNNGGNDVPTPMPSVPTPMASVPYPAASVPYLAPSVPAANGLQGGLTQQGNTPGMMLNQPMLKGLANAGNMGGFSGGINSNNGLGAMGNMNGFGNSNGFGNPNGGIVNGGWNGNGPSSPRGPI